MGMIKPAMIEKIKRAMMIREMIWTHFLFSISYSSSLISFLIAFSALERGSISS